jgi:bacterioferritin-associated ferredoxin
MILCICKGITDKAVEALIDRGAKDLHEIAQASGAGSCCGMCELDIQEKLRIRKKISPTPPGASKREKSP